MNNTEIDKLANEEGFYELGEILGSRRAFSAVAGRCSAADADCLRRIRDQRLFRIRAATWEEFCPKYLGMSKTNANLMIRHLEEFGPEYFDLAQLTKISPAQYRAIASAVKENAIHWNEEVIALIPENAEKVAAAVSDLRSKVEKEAPAPQDSRRRNPVGTLVRRGEELIAQFEALAASGDEVNPVKAILPGIRENLIRKLRQLDLAA